MFFLLCVCERVCMCVSVCVRTRAHVCCPEKPPAINASVFHVTRLGTFWTALLRVYRNKK